MALDRSGEGDAGVDVDIERNIYIYTQVCLLWDR